LIRSVSRALNIIVFLGNKKVGNDEIAKKTKMNKVTAHRLLKTLKSEGFVSQDPVTHEYYIGQEFIKLAQEVFEDHQLLNIAAHNEMCFLRDVTNETVVLAVKCGIEKQCVKEVGTQSSIRYFERLGHREPLHLGSGGKVILAQLDDSYIKAYFKNVISTNRNEKDISQKEIFNRLKKIKEEGYDISCGEIIESVAAIAVPIRNYIVPACLMVIGPANRWKLKSKNFIQDILKTRDQIENRLK
jgi:IclR family KDG regulon transcriptional repressor